MEERGREVVSRVKKHELARKMYVPIKVGATRSYGGRQQWFSKELQEVKDMKSYYTHANGCGVIALCDVFLYFAMTLPEGKKTRAGEMLDVYGNIHKEKYMAFVEEIRDQYAMIFGSSGTFAWQLSHAINCYCRDNGINKKAHFEVGISPLNLLKAMEKMLDNNQPIILMIGQSWPVVLSKVRKTGIPFFKQKRCINIGKSDPKAAYAEYKIAEKNVYGHFVVVTGILIDEHPKWASQSIMLRISSWGEEYYISYAHYCQFIKHSSQPWLNGIISIE